VGERFGENPAPPAHPGTVQAMARRTQTRARKTLHAKGKSMVETCFDIIKQVLEHRQFLPLPYRAH
jgi:hypothetical protein